MKLIVYDKAKYHYEAVDFPKDLKEKNAYIATGMFLGWVIDKGLYSLEFEEDFSEEIEKFKKRKITGSQLYKIVDGVLDSEILNTKGNEFAAYYFDFSKGSYLNDYEILLGKDLPSLYHIADTWDNYFALKNIIDQKFSEWESINKGNE